MLLYRMDRLAHEEAVASGGLLMYWYGTPDERDGENLATCVWTSREAAVRAARLPLHGKAARLAAASYEYFVLERYRLVKRAGQAELEILPLER